MTTAKSRFALVALLCTSSALSATERGPTTLETLWGRTVLKGDEIEGQPYIDIESLAPLISRRPSFEPALKLKDRRFLTMPISGTKQGSLPKAVERPLMLNLDYATKRQPVVISPRVTDWVGKGWIPLEDLTKATAAKMGSCTLPSICRVTAPDQCGSCLLVTGHE